MRSILLFLFFVPAVLASAQYGFDLGSYTFVKERNGKPKQVARGRALTLYLEDTTTIGAARYLEHSMTGRLIAVNGDSLWFDTYGEKLSSGDRTTRRTLEIARTYSSPDLAQALPLQRIQAVHLERKGKGWADFVLGTSSFCALLVAPAVGYEFKEGRFNGDRYVSFLVPSLIGVGTGAVLKLLTKPMRLQPVRTSGSGPALRT